MKKEDLEKGMLLRSVNDGYCSYDCIIKVIKVGWHSFDFKVVSLGDKSSRISINDILNTSLDNINQGNYIPVNKKVKRIK